MATDWRPKSACLGGGKFADMAIAANTSYLESAIMKPSKAASILAFCAGLVVASASDAAVYTWSSVPRIQDGQNVLEPVLVTGSRIYWGTGRFDLSWPALTTIQFGGSGGVGTVSSYTLSVLDRQATLAFIKRANVCTAPGLSQAAKDTTGGHDVLDRWQTANEVFTKGYALDAMAMFYYDKAVPPISIIIDGKAYKGFKMWYKDGYSETWVMMPNWSTASVKLFPDPAPGSLKPDGPGCMES